MILLVLIIKCSMANAKEKVQKRLSWIFHISLRIHETYKRTCKLSTFMTWIACDRVHKKNWKWNMNFTSIICKQKYLSASYDKIFLTFLLLNTNYKIIKFMSSLNSLLWQFLKSCRTFSVLNFSTLYIAQAVP